MKLIIYLALLVSLTQVQSQSHEGNWYTDYKGVVLLVSSGGYNESCVATLIHSQWLLTSAVCALKTYHQEMRILYGGYFAHFDIAAHIKNTYIHPEFFGDNRENDIALIELATPADESIRVFKIPRKSSSLVAKKARIVKWRPYIGDWGTTVNNVDNVTEDIPKEPRISYFNQVVIINNELCSMYPVHVSENRLCTYESVACEGDEGAPLVTNEANELVGLISVSEVQAAICTLYYNNCMIPVTTYTYVMPYRPWIRNVTGLFIL